MFEGKVIFMEIKKKQLKTKSQLHLFYATYNFFFLSFFFVGWNMSWACSRQVSWDSPVCVHVHFNVDESVICFPSELGAKLTVGNHRQKSVLSHPSLSRSLFFCSHLQKLPPCVLPRPALFPSHPSFILPSGLPGTARFDSPSWTAVISRPQPLHIRGGRGMEGSTER